MLVIVGYLVILGAVFGGFALAGGHLGSLVQPVELLMIGGAGLGAFLVANPRLSRYCTTSSRRYARRG